MQPFSVLIVRGYMREQKKLIEIHEMQDLKHVVFRSLSLNFEKSQYYGTIPARRN